MSTVLEKVLLNTHVNKLVQLFEDDPRVIWTKHRDYQTSSISLQQIAIVLSNRILNMTIATSISRTTFLEEFNKDVIKFYKVLADKMLESQKIGLLRRAANAYYQLIQAWSAVETVIANGSASSTPISYQKYMDYLVKHSKMLEEGKTNNTNLKVNIADSSYYMDSYEPEDSYYDKPTGLAAFMGERGDVDGLQHMLQFSQALRDRKLKPNPKL